MSRFEGVWGVARVACLLVVVVLTGCREQVATELDERQGLELMEALEGASLSARWRRGASPGAGSVTVRRAEASAARRVLLAHRLPRRDPDWLARLDEARGVVPSPELEAWRRVMVQALAVEASLSGLSGVRRAQLHVALDEQTGARRGGRTVATASVLLFGDPLCLEPACPRPGDDQVRRWVAGGFDGLSPETVEVGWVEPVAIAAPDRRLRSWGPWVVHERSLPGLRAVAGLQAALWMAAALVLVRRSGAGLAGVSSGSDGAAGDVARPGGAAGAGQEVAADER